MESDGFAGCAREFSTGRYNSISRQLEFENLKTAIVVKLNDNGIRSISLPVCGRPQENYRYIFLYFYGTLIIKRECVRT